MQSSSLHHQQHQQMEAPQQRSEGCSPQTTQEIQRAPSGGRGSLKKLIERQRTKVRMLEGMVKQLQADVERVERENEDLRAANKEAQRQLAEDDEGWPLPPPGTRA